MWAYWSRVLVAFGLLKAASRVMKDAEALLGVTQQTRDIEVTATDIPEAVEAADG